MHASSSTLVRSRAGRGLPVPFLNLLLLLLCTVMFGALAMGRRFDSRERMKTGVSVGTFCFSAPTARVHLTRSGELSWEGERIDSNELMYHALAHRARDESAAVIISASARTSLSKVVRVFKLLQRARVRYLVEIGSVERD